MSRTKTLSGTGGGPLYGSATSDTHKPGRALPPILHVAAEPLHSFSGWVKAGRPYWLLAFTGPDPKKTRRVRFCQTQTATCRMLQEIVVTPPGSDAVTAGVILSGRFDDSCWVVPGWLEVNNWPAVLDAVRPERTAEGGLLMPDYRLTPEAAQTFAPVPHPVAADTDARPTTKLLCSRCSKPGRVEGRSMCRPCLEYGRVNAVRRRAERKGE